MLITLSQNTICNTNSYSSQSRAVLFENFVIKKIQSEICMANKAMYNDYIHKYRLFIFIVIGSSYLYQHSKGKNTLL